jgi:hypothetical protein
MNAQELKLDYFTIYDVADYRVEYKVALQGQFDEEPKEAVLVALSYFANPVSKNREPIYDPNAHLTWYALYQPEPERPRTVVVENQFGQQTIWIGRPWALAVPAQKETGGPEGLSPFPEGLDHFKLYWVLEGEPVNKVVALQDQFDIEEAGETKVSFPFLFGVPVKKEYRGEVSPGYNEEAHLMIYRITPRLWEQARGVRDQFVARDLTFLQRVLLAVPSVKLEWEEWK